MSFDHLTTNTQKLLNLPDEERIQHIRSSRWIGYPRAQKILAKLEELLNYPKSDRMPNLLIIGDTNNGKTMLVKRFVNKYPAFDNPEGSNVIVPVLYVQCPPNPNEGRLYDVILDRLFAQFDADEKVGKKQMRVYKICKIVGLKMLILDEVQHLMAGSVRQQADFLNVLKVLGNELQIPIVAVGVREAFNAIHSDPQMSNRFELAPLPRWRLGDEEYERLLASFEALLPLKIPSYLADTQISNKLHAMSDGYIGELSRLLSKAAIDAINSKEEKITLKLLNKLDWIAPTKRKKQMDELLGF